MRAHCEINNVAMKFALLLLSITTAVLTVAFLTTYLILAYGDALDTVGLDDDDTLEVGEACKTLQCVPSTQLCTYYECVVAGDPPAEQCLLTANTSAACVTLTSTDATAATFVFEPCTDAAAFADALFDEILATISLLPDTLVLLNASCDDGVLRFAVRDTPGAVGSATVIVISINASFANATLVLNETQTTRIRLGPRDGAFGTPTAHPTLFPTPAPTVQPTGAPVFVTSCAYMIEFVDSYGDGNNDAIAQIDGLNFTFNDFEFTYQHPQQFVHAASDTWEIRRVYGGDYPSEVSYRFYQPDFGGSVVYDSVSDGTAFNAAINNEQMALFECDAGTLLVYDPPTR